MVYFGAWLIAQGSWSCQRWHRVGPKAELINQAAVLTPEVFLRVRMHIIVHIHRISQARLHSKASVLRSFEETRARALTMPGLWLPYIQV